MDSSKIKKVITGIKFDGDRTIITFGQNFTPASASNPVNENNEFVSDLPRHPDFNRAMERMKVHMILRSFAFLDFNQRIKKAVIDKDWFDQHLYEDDVRFTEAVVNNFQITTKKDVTGFYLSGHTLSVDDQLVKFKSPVVSTLKVDGGYNYPLLDLAEEHKNTLLLEAAEFLKYKNGDPQMRLAV